MNNSLTSLSYAVRFRVVGKYTSQLLIALSLLTLAPLIAAIAFGNEAAVIRYVIVIVSILAVSIPLSRIAEPAHIQSNEALVVVTLAFILSAGAMTWPLMAIGIPFGDALFEAISAVTTTGLTTITELQNRPAEFLFARAWMQWFGGLGIVVLSVAMLMGHHLAARHLEDPLNSTTIATTARHHARRVLTVYVCLTLTGLIVLWPLLHDGFQALLYVLSAVSTGGFAPHDDNLATFDRLHVRYTIMLLALSGAIPLQLYYRAWHRRVRDFFRDIEPVGLLLITFVICIALVQLLHFKSDLDWRDSITHGVLIGISAQTTSGFSSLDMSTLDDSSKIVTATAMLIGGSMGSTAGGFKVLRLLIILRLLHLLILRTTLPGHAVINPRLRGTPLDNETILRAMLVIVLFGIVVLISWLVFLVHGYPPVDALFEVASAVGTVGLTSGITEAALPGILKFVLCLDMLLGRVEIVALLVILYPRTWIGNRAEHL
ncbi:MAG: TrkH family potassium uptake protein [Gammaproteobacteria bacterium]